MSFTYDVNKFKETFEHEFTYIGGFMRNVHRFTDKPALFCPHTQQRFSYRELNEKVNQLSHALLQSNFGKNDVLMYQMPNSVEFVFCYLAPQKIGGINCPINPKLAPGETALILEDSKPKVFIYDSEISGMVTKALEMSNHKPEQIVMVKSREKDSLPKGHILFETYIENMPLTNPHTEIELHMYDEVTRLYTSGTTGLPKGVPLNSINEILSAHDVIMHFPLNPTDLTMNMTPWFHRGGLHSGGPTATLYAGGEVVVLRQFNPGLCLKYTQNYKITFLIGVPSILKTLASKQEKKKADLSSLKGIVTMGSPLEKSACIRFQEILTPNIFNGYGTTETFWNTFLRPYDLPNMVGTAGRSCTDDEVIVIKTNGEDSGNPDELAKQDNQEIGEVVIKCPTKTTYCYYNNPEETEKVYRDGYMYTGDLGTWDKNEFITIVGRKDDMIVSAGENIHPVQIEEILNEYDKVAEAIVTSVPDPLRGQSVAAYIIPADDSLTRKELAEYCSHHPMLASYKCPRYYRFVDELPQTSTGKKMHYKVRNLAKEDLEKGLLKRP